MLSFFLVALGVAYPIGSLVQGPVIDWIGMGWTTAGAAALLSLIMLAVATFRPGVPHAITTLAEGGAPGRVIEAETGAVTEDAAPGNAAAPPSAPKDAAEPADVGRRPADDSRRPGAQSLTDPECARILQRCRGCD